MKRKVVKVSTPGSFGMDTEMTSQTERSSVSDSLSPQDDTVDYLSELETSPSTHMKDCEAMCDSDPELASVEPKKSKRPTKYLTKHRRGIQKKKLKEDRMNIFAKAKQALDRGKFQSVRKCAAHYDLPVSTLHRLYTASDEYQGSGKKSVCLSSQEELLIIEHVKERVKIGCGVDFQQLQNLIQKSLLALVRNFPGRKTGYEECGQRPNRYFVRRFIERHNISLRRSSEISKGRQILTEADLKNWQEDTLKFMSNKPELRAALKDPARIFNMDETSVELGSSTRKVLAEKNTKVIYSISSGSREHITASYTVSANGDVVSPRCISKGVRNVAAERLKDLLKDGKSGGWKMSASMSFLTFRQTVNEQEVK